ncbi:GNAT family N-acetyltransferase [archaeon]|jgi:GNAT superfamily N-acetyltransferase|nr:GNAT family N-acetyltransferase [archaeon]MBT4416836.1 GNAT family N-acetyltransferase [archaeon]
MVCKALTPDYVNDFLSIFRAGLDGLDPIYTGDTIASARETYTAEHVEGLMAEGRISGCFDGDVLEGILVQGYADVPGKVTPIVNTTTIPWIMARKPGNGAGTNLMNYCIETAREAERNVDVVVVAIAKENTDAIRFYQKLGFEPNNDFSGNRALMSFFISARVRPHPEDWDKPAAKL